MAEQNFDPKRFKAQQKNDWDAAAEGWKKWWPIFERAAQHVSDRLVELAGVKPGDSVLDIATGNGEPAITAARHAAPGGRVVAIDQSPGMLAIARERLNRQLTAQVATLHRRERHTAYLAAAAHACASARTRRRRGGAFGAALWKGREPTAGSTLHIGGAPRASPRT